MMNLIYQSLMILKYVSEWSKIVIMKSVFCDDEGLSESGTVVSGDGFRGLLQFEYEEYIQSGFSHLPAQHTTVSESVPKSLHLE